MGKVLVTDGRSRASLAIVRSLGKRGIEITSGEAFRCSTFFSKYSKLKFKYPPPELDPDLFLKTLLEFVKKNNFDLIMPVRDEITSLLSKNILKFKKYTKIPTPSYESYRKGRDKALTIEIAKDIGIPHPRTVFIKSHNEHKINQIKKDFQYPLLLKPRVSSGSRGIIKVDSHNEFMDAFQKVKKKFGLPMIQEFIPQGGGAYGVSMLFNHGEPRAIFTHKRLREYPITGGPSTLRVSIRDAKMEKYAMKLLTELNWHGVAMVEFRVDPRTQEPQLMEINPRFWGSLPLAIAAGVDFPFLLYKMTMEGDVKTVFNYKLGVQVRWFLLGDILWYINCPNKMKNLHTFLKFKDKNLSYDIISLDDIGPSIGTFLEGAKSLTLKKRRKHAFNRGWQ